MFESEMQAAIAETYCEMARSGCRMRAVTEALEAIRDGLAGATSIFAAWKAFDQEIGRAEPSRFMPALVKLRSQFQQTAVTHELQRLNRAFEASPSEGWRTWLISYVGSFDESGWRGEYGQAIADAALPFSPASEWPVEQVRECARLVLQGRWPEVYDWFIFLSRQELSADRRACMLAIAAEIQLFHFFQPSRTKKLLEQARELAPEEIRTWIAWGEYHLQQEQLEQARSSFEHVVQKMPDIADGFVGLGDCAEKVGDLTLMEEQYQQAILNAPGMPSGYLRLMNFYGRPNWFKDRQDRIDPLFQRALALEDNPASVWVSLGLIYKQNGELERARECFEQAIRLKESYANAHAWLGYAWLDEANKAGQNEARLAEMYRKAGDSFGYVVKIAPKALDGYWGMSWLFMMKRDWPAALEWCDRGLQCHPEWESFVRVRRGDILREMGRWDEAEQELQRSLELEPLNPGALNSLSALADKYQSPQAREVALRALERLRWSKGEAYEDTYRNRVGNVLYYHRDYPAAAAHYRLAIKAKPGEAVFHSNLAGALEKSSTPGKRLEELAEALSALRRALELSPEQKEYSARLERLETERRFVLACGEDALKLDFTVVPIRIRMHPSMYPDILTRDGALSAETLAKIDQLRKRIRKRFGFILPSLTFSELSAPRSGRFQIEVLEKQVLDDTALADRNSPELWSVLDYVMNRVEGVVTEHMSDLAGYEELSALLGDFKSEACTSIRNSPPQLIGLLRVVRGMLRRQVPVLELDRICEEYMENRASGASIGAIIDRLCAEFAESSPGGQQGQAEARG